MFDRYLNRPDATSESFLTDQSGQRWFKTGDCATKTSLNGAYSYRIMGRLYQDIIKKGGFKISALEIESVLLQHQHVKEACVFSIPCDKYGEEIVA